MRHDGMGWHSLPDNVKRTHYDSGAGIQEFQCYAQDAPGNTVNGLKVVVKNNDFQGSATHFNLIVDCGSRNENLNQLGGAHLLKLAGSGRWGG